MSEELDKEIMDCWLLSSRAEVFKRLAALIHKREREAWEQGLIDGWTAAREEVETYQQEGGYSFNHHRHKKFQTLQEFKDWKKERERR